MTSITPILLYHSIGDAPTSPGFARWQVTADALDSHLQALTAEGWAVRSVAEIRAAAAAGGVPARTVGLTFDDGLADFATAAMPVLRRHGVRPTLYVTTGHLGATARWLGGAEADRPMLAAGDVAALHEEGVDIGAHGHTHAMLDLLDPEDLTREIRCSRTVLTDITGVPPSSLAYPHGHASRVVRRTARAHGFATAVGVLDRTGGRCEDPMRLPRIVVDPQVDADGLLRRLVRRPGAVRAVEPPRILCGRLLRSVSLGRAQRELASA